MKAIRFNPTIARYIAGITLGKISKRFLWSALSPTCMEDIPEPELPGEEWVLVKTRYGGICGSDISAIQLKSSPYFSALTSFPSTLGHENVGQIAYVGQDAQEWALGERVIVEPILWCRPRGFQTYCRFCAQGEINRCERISEGDLAPALSIGFCRDTGGSWSPYFLAHKSQLYRVPGAVSDENGLMVEPFAVGLHAVLNSYPEDDEKVLIIGAGAIGLCTLAALRCLGSKCQITIQARHHFQVEAARKLGADQIISQQEEHGVYNQVAKITAAKILKPILGKPVIWGGFDRVYECVGSNRSLDSALRFTRAGGNVVLVGVPGIAKNVDWSSIFIKELNLQSAYVYNHAEHYHGELRKTFEIALELMESGAVDLSWMVTQRFSLEEYKTALQMQDHKGEHQVIRSVFQFDG